MQIIVTYDVSKMAGTIQIIFQGRDDIVSFIDNLLKPVAEKHGLKISLQACETVEHGEVVRV